MDKLNFDEIRDAIKNAIPVNEFNRSIDKIKDLHLGYCGSNINWDRKY